MEKREAAKTFVYGIHMQLKGIKGMLPFNIGDYITEIENGFIDGVKEALKDRSNEEDNKCKKVDIE